LELIVARTVTGNGYKAGKQLYRKVSKEMRI